MSRRARIPALPLDDLDAWLAAQPDIARRNWRVTSIDGFAAAIAVGPDRVPMEDWLRVIFGPSLPETPMGLGAISAVIGHMNAVRQGLRLDGGQRWRPLYLREEDGTVIAQPWAAGFMFAVKRWPAAWRPIFETGHHVTFMLPIIALEAEEEAERLTAANPEARAHLARAYHHVPEAVLAIRDYWHAHRTHPT
ncbi:YecA family protein (plasmid) [Roseomonas sp. CCTCC AB2023176]|uniref:YecA/YgfB family protein n=1 Tax=Roseomonas sp. CCTCC AB2023176 TaxID=3342640 RepID=UPI0035D887C4